MSGEHRSLGHIRLTSHSGGVDAPPIRWGAPTAAERGPVIGTTGVRTHRNVIGTHGGSYSLYRALAVSSGALSPLQRPDLANAESELTHRIDYVWVRGAEVTSACRAGHRQQDRTPNGLWPSDHAAVVARILV